MGLRQILPGAVALISLTSDSSIFSLTRSLNLAAGPASHTLGNSKSCLPIEMPSISVHEGTKDSEV